ncbi:hypothetical protein DL766_008190 [Monosporascus sp. MC13-8B]|uniref:Uncharacterized protein n=1 Tax=Monosporascus cannonballus TaxID=155416 RepID=A0ABY0HKR0_9PEZI|nr:hypothetical protein DL762_000004 [Monosporascus cannonballus]RYP20462.1 hypothetical protein DL766_008190 [Monosporascus sp. MC13-8B]
MATQFSVKPWRLRRPQYTSRFHNPAEVQLCTLMNIKTGGFTEDRKRVLAAASAAKENGSTRFCMGAVWHDMIDAAQARGLKAAGLTAYNHNVDTSREFYPSVISTRTYDERLL